jgi:hypothetical protein
MIRVLRLQPQDDLASIRHRIGWIKPGRVALVIPWDMRFLSRELDFDLLRREAERWHLEIAVVSTDFERRGLAHKCGFPAFASIGSAKRGKSWQVQSPEGVEPPPRHWWNQPIDLRPRRVRSLPEWFTWAKLGVRVLLFVVAIAVVLASAYVVVPSSTITLVPATAEFSTIVPVSVDLDIEEVDLAARLIPARRVGDEFEGYIQAETTGEMRIVAGRATGQVIFTNLLVQDYVVPAGTVVRTSSTSYPIRFRTTESVAVPAAGTATAPVEALEDGVGNVGAFQINQVEGVASSAVAVINPEATTGAEPVEARVVTQADYDRAREQLTRQLLDQAVDELSANYLEPTEILLPQSLSIQAVPKLAYDRFVTEQSDTVGLNMRILVSGWAVDVDNAEVVAYAALIQHIPPGFELTDARFELGELAEEDVGSGSFALFVTAHGTADALLDPRSVTSLVRGERLDTARDLLVTEIPLAEEPQIVLWPTWPKQLRWLERMPLVPLRIDVRVISRTQPAMAEIP